MEIAIESGLLSSVLYLIWKAGAVVQEFRIVKDVQEKHIEDDKDSFDKVEKGLVLVTASVARIEGRLEGIGK